MRETGKLSNSAKWLNSHLKYCLQLNTKDVVGSVLGLQRGIRQFMEMEKQMLVKNLCWARQRQWDPERNFNKQTWLGLSLSTRLVHTTVICVRIGPFLEQVLHPYFLGS